MENLSLFASNFTGGALSYGKILNYLQIFDVLEYRILF